MYRNSPKPCHVQLRVKDVIVAEDIADKYRPDLLRAGIGYGHCAFYACIRGLEPGRYPLRLFDGRTGTPLGVDEHVLYDIPPFESRPPKSVKELLAPRDQWQDSDLLMGTSKNQRFCVPSWLASDRARLSIQ